MNNLLPGLRKFSERIFPQQKTLFESLSQSQKPHTLIITCSDSRIDPNLLTQSQPGEIFVIRNAGNIIPPYGSSRGGEEAAIEFALDGLGITNIVICGHSHCGAMRALVHEHDLDHLPSVKSWLGHAEATKRRVAALHTDLDLDRVIEENVLVQSDNLRTHPCVSAGMRAGKIHIFGWVYHFETGSTALYDPQMRRFLPSIEVQEDAENNVARFSI